MRVSGCGWQGKRLAGVLLVLAGVLLIFVCLPARLFLIALGLALAVAGLLLLRGRGGKRTLAIRMVCVRAPRFLRGLLRLLSGKK